MIDNITKLIKWLWLSKWQNGIENINMNLLLDYEQIQLKVHVIEDELNYLRLSVKNA